MSQTRFIVQTSDVLADMRVNVLAEGSDKVIWFKERFLEDEEIVEHLIHHGTQRLCWSMHRPRHGWYIRIRAPTFPHGAFIPFIPAPDPAGALLFSSRTHVPNAPDVTPTEEDHSYPPTPTPAAATLGPDLVVHPPTPTTEAPPSTQITQFVLAPYSADPRPPAEQSFFSRVLSVIRAHAAEPSYSFTLTRVLPPPYAAPAASTTALTSASSPPTPASPTPPLLTFTDRTPTLTYSTVTGLLALDEPQLRRLGVDTSFWIAVALTYLEFLQEKESYLAALSD